LLNASNKIRQQIVSSKDIAMIKEYQEWLDAKDYLSHLYGMSKSDLVEQKINLDLIENLPIQKKKLIC